ncbi:MAG: response regulator, partial [Woeseia sp.]|nr:response regulator [Woeseia sp.]
MALKRALVVDDSKVARLTLKKQLEKYHLNVEVAESGEAAIELLKTHMVDVIFMDHIMPGMDGLEAVALIKRNPLTATIPVMMYTSKEGEVYVSEARALGAVGVLPKQVQPGVLFGMLLKLGLVRDRRSASSDDVAEIPATSVPDRRQRDPESAPAGFEVSALMTRILEDQHSELRSEIRSSYAEFAKQVADEVQEQLREHHELERMEDDLARQRSSGWQILSGVLAIAAMLFLALFVQVRSEREAAYKELGDLAAYLERVPPA